MNSVSDCNIQQMSQPFDLEGRVFSSQLHGLGRRELEHPSSIGVFLPHNTLHIAFLKGKFLKMQAPQRNIPDADQLSLGRQNWANCICQFDDS